MLRRERDKLEPLTDSERTLMQRLFSHSGEWPSEFISGIKAKLEVNPPRFLISESAGVKGEEWREVGATGNPAFVNSWVNFGGALETAAFYMDASGIVRVKGIVKDGVIDSPIFTLPAGYRPAGTVRFATDSNGAYAYVDIASDGTVDPRIGNNTSFSLNNISFRAA